MLKYFIGCTAENLKKRYKELAFKYHPDRGGDTEIMKAINAEFEEAVAYFTKHQTAENQRRNAARDAAEFREIIEKIIPINADIEIIGCWIWVFNAYPYRELLKACGFKWASKKRAWTWHPDNIWVSRGNGKKEIGEIRMKYGSEKLKTYKAAERLAAV